MIIAHYAPKNPPSEFEKKHAKPTFSFIFPNGKLARHAIKIALQVGDNVLTDEQWARLREDSAAQQMVRDGVLKFLQRQEVSLVQAPAKASNVPVDLIQASLDA